MPYYPVKPRDRQDERREMVNRQILPRGIKDKNVLEAMLTVPRHYFLPEKLQARAYEDRPLPIGQGQTISQPYIVAFMAEALEPEARHRVLEIGTGSGYAAAVLSRIVSRVYTVERHNILADEARARLNTLGYHNIRVKTGDGTKGWADEAPFDSILVSAGAPWAPEALLKQLKPDGILVIPVGDRGCQELLRIRKHKDGGCSRENIGLVQFVPLIGEEGWGGE
ncbi:protein-L-isoaspartate O-methyltransferase [Desulfocucumis palustris]|uniref:Protein-L-isoaspartate O-methyltransferase n=1 Tax=Desulfocucumis palustris TaxID=1898651 RepID=A0A2L2XIP4_9FIRM|nr:protein-L-isoaspartate(D-aspartate) O-methyltransferase [Desulfocucumis palustris]GBF35573.1 protein-L-isoaspartate O-methyltransferase [Desulfocucumis palustris]